MIGNMITSARRSFATPLQISLAVLLRDSKEHVKTLHDFGVTCSYDELLRFKKSVAFFASSDMMVSGLDKNSGVFVQAVADNFDQEISSQNGRLQTHSMALLLAQNETNSDQCIDASIPRIHLSKMRDEVPYEVNVSRYTGPKKP